ncbi:MAG: glycoside hydrolase family 3 C-terminal domain-containing protein, partial [Oscillospiraceae bacterium]|nr:glycoside hydrolase family 3 C-terminal domain-containing protein [Oscillospiraceae bacterium]
RPNRFGFAVVTILLVIVLLVSTVLSSFRNYFGLVDNIAFTKAPTGQTVENVTERAKAITLQEAEEGIVLLTNKNNTLPLGNGAKINVFGRGSYYATFGGTGSGAGGTNYTSLYDGLRAAGLQLNEDLVSFYAENAKEAVSMGLVGTDFGLYENPASDLSDSLIAGAKSFSDIAVYVISRVGGEGDDLPMDTADYYGGESGRHYLELNAAEESMLSMLEDNFGTVVVVLNSTNAMELGFLEDENVDAALWSECYGSVGTVALGEILCGAVNPSGRTTDTFAYEVESNPTYYSFGAYDYTNAFYSNDGMMAGTGDALSGADPYHYVKYNEGVYVGYRFYETASADGFIDYDKTVQFPFGYGLSYTNFTQTLDQVSFDGTTVTAAVTVKNTGSVPGKDVVELYYSAPYTKGGIEKSEVVLGGFAKIGLLEPGQSETVTIRIAAEDMASYDYSGIKASGGAYVLEAGEYDIRLQSDSHNMIDHRTVTVAADVIYNEANDGKRPSDGIAVVNLFDDVTYGEDIVYLSRADWAGTMPTERAPSTSEAPTAVADALLNPVTVLADSSPANWKTTNHGLKITDMKGVAYEDEKWDQLLDQVSKEEMVNLISNGGWQTAAVSSVGKARYLECDGPNGLNNLMAGFFAGVKGNMYTNQAMLAQTWNADLAYQKGLVYGEEARAYGVAGIYGPAANIHRSPFSGRNYEYYSEDGYLSGMMAERELTGIKEAGVYCYFKHFAVNDQETNRDHGGLATWLNEQALREIYLKGFEVAVKGGNATGIMSSFNRIGTTPTAESSELLNTVLRDEWGFRGAVITDCVMACTTENINRATLAGNDFQLSFGLISSLSDELTGSVSGQQAMRQATKNVLYMVANSDGPELYRAHMTTIGTILLVVGVVLLALFAQYYVRYFLRLKKWKKGEPIETK